MKRIERVVMQLGAIAACFALFPYRQFAQEKPRPPNTPDTIERGHAFFADNCGICHGIDVHGGDKGPDLSTGQFRHAISDEDLLRVITHGVPGTIMPANDLPPEQVWSIVAYLRSTVVANRSATSGDKEAGKQLFWNTSKCANCHMVNGKGGVLGPDLSQIGAARTLQYLMQKITAPNKALTTGFHEPNADYVVPISHSTVTVITKLGKGITGVPKNEDTFSIQMLGTDNELHNFLKKDLKNIIHEQKSLMPAYTNKELSDSARSDLLAYLASLHGGAQ